MTGKITLITPPDIYENNNGSILFIHLNEADQATVSRWLGERDLVDNLNFYVYNNEVNTPWLLWASGICQYKYIDVDGMTEFTSRLGGYLLSKNNLFYKTADEDLAALYGHINTNRILKIENFLERVFSDQKQ
jgi:hypothetical protein